MQPTQGVMSAKDTRDPPPQRGTNTRMRERLQASLAGLEELRMLRDRQQDLVDDAKSMMDRSKIKRLSESQSSLLEYIRPEEHTLRHKRHSLSVLHENEILRQESATHDIVQDWLQTTNTLNAKCRKPQFKVGSSSNSDSSSSKCSSSANSPQDSPRNSDVDAKSKLGDELVKGDIEPKESVDTVDGKDVSQNCDKSDIVGATDAAFQQSVSELSGYSKCSPHRRFSLDATLLAEIQRKPFTLPYGASSSEKSGAKVEKPKDDQNKPTEIDNTADDVKESKVNAREKEEIRKSAAVVVDKTDGSDVRSARVSRRQSFDSSARAGPPPVINLPRRASFSGFAPSPRSTYQKSYTLSGCKTKFNFPSPLHAVLMNRQKVVLSEENDCAVSSSGSDTADFSRSSETLYETDSQVHDHLYTILSQDDSLSRQQTNSPREEKLSPREIQLRKANNAGGGRGPTSTPFSYATMGAGGRRATFDSGNMNGIRGFSDNTRRASIGDLRRPLASQSDSTQETAPPLKPRMRKNYNPRSDYVAPPSVATNKNSEARNAEVQSNTRGQVDNIPRSRGSVDSFMNSYQGGNIPRSRGSIDSIVNAMSGLDSPRSEAEPAAYSTPRSASQKTGGPRSRNPLSASDISAISPPVVDKGPQTRPTKLPRDSNNNGPEEDNNVLRISDDSLKFSRCGSPDSLFDRPPPVPEKRFSLRSEAGDSGFTSSCMSLLTASSGYSYKAKSSYDPKLSIASIEEGYISSQSTDSPKQKHHSHKLSIRSDCSFMSTGSSYFAEDELSEDEHHSSDQADDPPRMDSFSRTSSENSLAKPPRSVEVNRISCATDAKRLDSKGDPDRPVLRKGSLASNTLSDFRQILHENKKNHNKTVNMQSPASGRRYSLPINALCPQSALRQKYLCYNNDMAPIQDTSI